MVEALDGTPATKDPEERARLVAEWERIDDVMSFNDVLIEAGYTPPDEHPGWMAVREFGPESEDLGIVWAAPFDG